MVIYNLVWLYLQIYFSPFAILKEKLVKNSSNIFDNISLPLYVSFHLYRLRLFSSLHILFLPIQPSPSIFWENILLTLPFFESYLFFFLIILWDLFPSFYVEEIFSVNIYTLHYICKRTEKNTAEVVNPKMNVCDVHI